MLRQRTGNSRVEALVADLSNQRDVRRLAEEFLARHSRLDVLVNNAGAIFFSRSESVDGIEMTFALNHLGYFLLTNLLLGALEAARPSRVISVSAHLHRLGRIRLDDLQTRRRRYFAWRAYADSKLANVLFTAELARRLEGTGVTANVLAPGIVATHLANEVAFIRVAKRVLGGFLLSPEEGAQTIVYLASSPEVSTVTGTYFHRSRAVRPAAAVFDAVTAGRLWDVSAELTGLSS